jgi:hypothetical protein
MMNLVLTRYSDNGDSTQGLLHEVDENVKSKFLNYTLEDEAREVKVAGETCIPIGAYQVKFNKNLTPMTEKYKRKFEWFTWHLHLQNVPDFEGIYIHIGNTDEDSKGCILVQDEANNNQIEEGFNASSTSAFKRLYNKIFNALNNDEAVYIVIQDLPMH